MSTTDYLCPLIKHKGISDLQYYLVAEIQTAWQQRPTKMSAQVTLLADIKPQTVNKEKEVFDVNNYLR